MPIGTTGALGSRRGDCAAGGDGLNRAGAAGSSVPAAGAGTTAPSWLVAPLGAMGVGNSGAVVGSRTGAGEDRATAVGPGRASTHPGYIQWGSLNRRDSSA